MVHHFKVADWASTINTPNGVKKGITLEFNDPIPEDVVIQLYESHPNEYALVMNIGISIYENSVVIFGDNAFDGKLVVK